MPLYEYQCSNGHTHVEQRSMTAPQQQQQCEDCGANLQRVFTPAPIHFRGNGFYRTDK